MPPMKRMRSNKPQIYSIWQHQSLHFTVYEAENVERLSSARIAS